MIPLLAKSLIWVARDRSPKGDPVTDLIGYESSRLDYVVFCPAHALDLIVARSIHSQIRTTIRDVVYRHEINLLRVRAIDSEVIDVTSVRAVLATAAPDRCREAHCTLDQLPRLALDAHEPPAVVKGNIVGIPIAERE
jgi:hypothetical protein